MAPQKSLIIASKISPKSQVKRCDFCTLKSPSEILQASKKRREL